MKREKEVCQRLGHHDGVVSCLDSSGVGIQMALMTPRNLRDHLKQKDTPKFVQLAWLQDMARTLVYAHDRRVIVADVATRNFLLDNHLSVKMSDFTVSSISLLTADMETVNDSG